MLPAFYVGKWLHVITAMYAILTYTFQAVFRFCYVNLYIMIRPIRSKFYIVMHMRNSLLSYFNFHCRKLFDICSSLLITNFFQYLLHVLLSHVLDLLCFYFLLPHSCTTFVSFRPWEVFSSPISNLHSTNARENSDSGNNKSSHRSLFGNVGKEIPIHASDLFQYN